MSTPKILVVSIDGVAPRFVTPASMPFLCDLARQGASCFAARTVYPSITLPAHTSLLRGIDPAVHGLTDNTPGPLDEAWPTFLLAARQAGLRTAALLNWSQVNGIVEEDALDVRYFLNGGYGLDDDDRVANAAVPILAEAPDVAFAYLVSPDLAGHDHGWGSPQYITALGRSDRALGSLLETVGSHHAVIVTTDHGGHGNDHQQSQPLDMQTFIVARAPGIAPGSVWSDASILDIAPTVAALAGFEAAQAWSGRSLIAREQSLTDYLLDRIREMEHHSYGERVNMLEHSLQTAAAAEEAGADSAMIIAALLHDVGHLMGEAGQWGLPNHAEVAASALQQVLPRSIIEPIRLHVDAKRYLVTTDPSYRDRLSPASIETLALQGGALSAEQTAAFEAEPFAEQAVLLRRFDDAGKTTGIPTPNVEDYRELLAEQLEGAHQSGPWLRESCRCPSCVDPQTGQHLIDVADSAGWSVVGDDMIAEGEGTRHRVESARVGGDMLPTTLWAATHSVVPAATVDEMASQVSEFGIAVMRNIGDEPGSVLRFASSLGFVRSTNYGDSFDVRAIADPNNLAYTNLGLPLHTDNPYRDPVPTVQLLHCITPANVGGSSRFCDGFAVAEQLRSSAPDAFRKLSTTNATFRFCDETVDLQAQHPLIDLAVDGSVRAIHLNHRSMVIPPAGPATDAFLDAYRVFASLLNSPTNVVEIDMASGDVVAFDNRRVLHSRTSFSSASDRHLEGCYIDIDAVHSIARRHRLSVATLL